MPFHYRYEFALDAKLTDKQFDQLDREFEDNLRGSDILIEKEHGRLTNLGLVEVED